MSSCLISAAEQPACQPWELASFDSPGRGPTKAGAPEVALPTIEQIARIEEQARQEGHAAGHAEGRAEGLREAAAEAARVRALADAFAHALGEADEQISRQILELALDLARAMLKSALTARPELVLPVVREAVRYLPAVQQPALLCLHPGDAALVQQHMGDELTRSGWQITQDPQLEPGGCRIETLGNQIDATLPTRWQRLATALGQSSEWLV